MKKICIFIAILAFASQSIIADVNKSCGPCSKPKKHKSSKKHKSCNNRYVITEKDFSKNDRVSKTLVISKPGNYCFGETIHWNPKQRNQTALIIDASNVHLDLNGYELKQVNTQGRQTGIFVRTGHDTISIANGAVRDFTQLGIVVEGNTSNIFLGNEDTFLKVTGCGYGSTFSFLDNVSQEPILQGGIRLGETKAFEAQGYYTWLGNVDIAQLVNVYAEENGPVGLYLGTGSNISSENSLYCRNTDNRQVGNPDPLGVGLVDADWCIVYGVLYIADKNYGDTDSNTFDFLNCHFDNNSMTATGLLQWCSGFLFGFNINGIAFRACTFNSNSGNGEGEGTEGAACGGCNAIVYEDCQANNNLNSAGLVRGFLHAGLNGDFNTITSSKAIVYRRCVANGNVSNASVFPRALGFDFLYVQEITLEDCIAQNNEAVATDPDNAFGFADGLSMSGSFDPFTEAKNGVISGCHFSGNNVNFSGGDVEGIFIGDPAARIVIKNCVIQDNTGAGGDFNSGIWIANFGSGINGIVIENSTIEGQSLGLYSNGDTNSIYQYNTLTDVDFGVLLDGSSCDSVNNNYVTNATNGFVDFADQSTSLFANNRTFNVATPFDITYAAGAISTVAGFGLVTGDLTANPPFPSGAQVLDNVAMAGDPACTRSVRCSAEAKAALQEKAAKALEARQQHLSKFGKR